MKFSKKIEIIPDFKDNVFNHQYYIKGISSNDINNVYIRHIEPPKASSFVDFLVFTQELAPVPSQVFENCLFAIEETKTNTFASRNSAMGQRSAKFLLLEYLIQTNKYETIPVMYFSYKQAEEDHDSVLFITNLLQHLESGLRIWGKDNNIQKFKPFSDLDKMINKKNEISSTNNRSTDVLFKVRKLKDRIEIDALLANPGKRKPNWTGRIGYDPNMGQVPLLAYVIRKLGWKKEIKVTNHQLSPIKVETSKNKFVKLANWIGFTIDNCKIQKTSLDNSYWRYTDASNFDKKEKIASILCENIFNSNGLETIFSNHGGCEKSYFITETGEDKTIAKYFAKKCEVYKEGGKIPDLVLADRSAKHIYILEGKRHTTYNQGLKELKGFDKFEKEYINTYWPNYSASKLLIINGGEFIECKKIFFQLNKDSKIYSSIKI